MLSVARFPLNGLKVYEESCGLEIAVNGGTDDILNNHLHRRHLLDRTTSFAACRNRSLQFLFGD